MVINNDTSTHSIPVVANSVTFTITPGEAQMFIWDGSAWGPTDLGITDIPVKVVQGGTGASTLTDHGVLLGSGTDPITALGAMTNGQLVIGSTGADPVVASITDGEGIDITAGAGTLTIACKDASTSNKGVVELATNAETATGESTTLVVTTDDLKYRNDSQCENITSLIQYPIPTSGYMLKAAADGSPATGTNTDTDVADAVTKKHTQNTDTGTTATSFKINTGGSEADLQTTGLTADRDFTFPDIDTMLAGSVLLAQNTCEIIEYNTP
jgi:hypothetical protein